MVHRYLFIAAALVASSLPSIESANSSIRSSIRSEDATNEHEPDWVRAEMTVEKGFKCKAGADKKKMSGSRECEGGFKQAVGAQLSPNELAATVVGAGIADLRSSMMEPDSNHQNLLPEEIVEELVRWDTEGELVFEDCSDDGESCKKTLEFGGYAKLFWGCNITFAMKGKKVGKTVECGGKSFEGAGSKLQDYYYNSYYGDENSESAKAKAKMMAMAMTKNKNDYTTVPSETVDSESLPIKGYLSPYNLFFRDEQSKILDEHHDATKEDQASIVLQRWHELEDETKNAYREFAEADAIRYQAEVKLHSALAAAAAAASPKQNPQAVDSEDNKWASAVY